MNNFFKNNKAKFGALAIIGVLTGLFPIMPEEIKEVIKDAIRPKTAQAAVHDAPLISVRVGDIGCSTQFDVSSVMAYPGGNVVTSDSNGKDPDCVSITLDGVTPIGGPYDTQFNYDFRLGIRLAESEGSCTTGETLIGWTDWVSNGSGFGQTQISGYNDADCVRVYMEARPLPEGKALQNVNVGIGVNGQGLQVTAGGQSGNSVSSNGGIQSGQISVAATVVDVPYTADYVSTTVPTIPANMIVNQPGNYDIVMKNTGGNWLADQLVEGTSNCDAWIPSSGNTTCTDTKIMSSTKYKLKRVDNIAAVTSDTLFDFNVNATATTGSFRDRTLECDDGTGYETVFNFVKTAHALPDTDTRTCRWVLGEWQRGGTSIAGNSIRYNENATFKNVNLNVTQSGSYALKFRVVKLVAGNWQELNNEATLNISTGDVNNPDFNCNSIVSQTISNSPGSSGIYAVGVSPLYGFNGNVNVNVSSGLPSGASANNKILTSATGYADFITVQTAGVVAGTYNLIFSFDPGVGAPKTCNSQLIVQNPAPPQLDFYMTNNAGVIVEANTNGNTSLSVDYGQYVYLTWLSDQISGNCRGMEGVGDWTGNTTLPQDNTNATTYRYPSLVSNTYFTIECTGINGQTISRRILANVVNSPTPTTTPTPAGPVSVTAFCSPQISGPFQQTTCNVQLGSPGYISYTSVGASECFLTYPGFSDEVATSGVATIPQINSSVSPVVNCQNGANSAQDSVTFNVATATPTPAEEPPVGPPSVQAWCSSASAPGYIAGPCTVENGVSGTVKWTAIDSSECTLNGLIDGDFPPAGQDVSTGNLTSGGTVTFSCAPLAGYNYPPATAVVQFNVNTTAYSADIKCATQSNPNSFSNGPCTMPAGSMSRLEWSSNTQGCKLYKPGGEVDNTAPNFGPGDVQTLNSSHAYVLNCYNDPGHTTLIASDSVNFNITPLDPTPTPFGAVSVTASCSANATGPFNQTSCPVVSGSSGYVSWTSVNASECFITYPGYTNEPVSINSTQEIPNVTSLVNATVECSGGGGNAQSSVQFTLFSATPTPTITTPIIKLYINGWADANGDPISPVPVNYDGSAYLTWTTTNTQGTCTGSNGLAGWTGNSTLPLQNTSSTAYVYSNLISSTTFTLNCTGPGGNASASVTAQVAGQPTPTPSQNINLSCSPGTLPSIEAGQMTTFTVDVAPVNGYIGNVGLSISFVTAQGANAPTLSIDPASLSVPGTSIGRVNTTTTTAPQNYNVLVTATGPGVSATCQVIAQVNAPGAGSQPSVTATSAACENINIDWSIPNNSPAPDTFSVWRSSSNTGPWTQIHSMPFVSGTYNYNWNYAISDTSGYYYAVSSVRGGTESAKGVSGLATAFACAPNISTSDKDLIAIDDIPTAGPVSAACNDTSELYKTAADALVKAGSIAKFRICVENTGNVEFTGGQITDNPTNISSLSIVQTSPNGCATGGGTNMTLQNLAPNSRCEITLSGRVTPPADPDPIERFANSGVITGTGGGQNLSKNISTPPYNFSNSSAPPSRGETAP